MPRKLRVGILGYGRMGREFVAAMQENGLWDVAAVYDICGATRRLAQQQVPNAAIYDDPKAIFSDTSIDAVGLFTLADARPQQIREALAARKHVLAEKPIGPDVATEWQLVSEIEASDRFVAVNLFNRNAWYHKDIQQFLREGEIGDLAVIRICHMTPGHMPMEGHDPEGPPFHDCGMHYVDVARWYAKSEYQTWHAQGIRAWGYKDPWWVQAHGTFANGVVFDITQGFIYGHLAKEQPHNCYVDAIGTKGVARMRHDFGADRIHIAIVRLLFGQVPVDKSLGNVEHHAVGECAVRLHPPRIFVPPGANPLGMPGLVFALGVPAGYVHVMHPAVVERRAFGIVPFQRHVARRHMADPDHGQVANLPLRNKSLNVLVVPGVPIEQVDRY